MALPIFTGGAATVSGLIWDADLKPTAPYKIEATTALNAEKLNNHFESELNVSSAIDAENATNALLSQKSNKLDVIGTVFYATAETGTIAKTWSSSTWNLTLQENQVLWEMTPTEIFSKNDIAIGYSYGQTGKYTSQSTLNSSVSFRSSHRGFYATVNYTDGTNLQRYGEGNELTISKVLPFNVFVLSYSVDEDTRLTSGSLSCNFKQ